MTLIRSLRYVAIAEGISFVVLLFVAMPLKYIAGIPEAVKVTGWIHGALFILFIALVWRVMDQYRQSFLWLIKGCIASVVPFGTFVWDRSLKKLETETTSS